jgi:hypothetical protein
MHSCTNHATLPTSSNCIKSLKLDMAGQLAPQKRESRNANQMRIVPVLHFCPKLCSSRPPYVVSHSMQGNVSHEREPRGGTLCFAHRAWLAPRESSLHERAPQIVATSCHRNEQERAYRQSQLNMEIHSAKSIEANIFLGQRWRLLHEGEPHTPSPERKSTSGLFCNCNMLRVRVCNRVVLQAS